MPNIDTLLGQYKSQTLAKGRRIQLEILARGGPNKGVYLQTLLNVGLSHCLSMVEIQPYLLAGG